MRQQQYHVTLTEPEYQLLLQAMLDFRNCAAREDGPTEDINDLIQKVTKSYRRRWFCQINCIS